MTDCMNSNFEISLSSGSLQMILDGKDIDSVILQILGYKKIAGEGNDRFRLLLNDGIRQFSFSILATQLNHLIVNKELEKFSVLKLNKYVCTQAHPNKKIIICLDVTPLVPGCRINTQIDYTRNKHNTTKYNPHSFLSSSGSISEFTVKKEIKDLDEMSSIYSTNNCRNLSQFDIQSLKPSSSTTNKILASTSKSICGNQYWNKEANITAEKPDSIAHSSLTTFTPKQTFSSPKLENCVKYESQTKISCSLINFNESSNNPLKKISIIPISSLTPYQSKWTIKARVIYKTHIVDYTNVKKSGKLFTFYLLDSSGEIRATAFDNLAEQISQIIELDKVYYISNATVKLPKSDTPSKYDFELCISFSTKVEVFKGNTSDIPSISFKFIPLNQVEPTINSFVDVIGVCIDYSELKIIKVKGSSKEVQKLDFTIADMQNSLMTVSLWGIEAEKFKPQNNPIIALKNAKVTNFNKCSLSVSSSSMIFINPPIKDVHLLKSWFNKHCKDIQLNLNLSIFERNQTWKRLSDITIDAFNGSDKSYYYTVKATVIMVQKENTLYQSCPSSDCFKKISVTPNNLHHCSKCNKDYNSFSWTLMLNLNIADFSAGLWVVAFRETAELIIKLKTEELSDLKEKNFAKYMEILSDLHFKSFIFKLRSRIEYFNGTSQLKTTILEAKPVESSYTKKLLFDINCFNKIIKDIK